MCHHYAIALSLNQAKRNAGGVVKCYPKNVGNGAAMHMVKPIGQTTTGELRDEQCLNEINVHVFNVDLQSN